MLHQVHVASLDRRLTEEHGSFDQCITSTEDGVLSRRLSLISGRRFGIRVGLVITLDYHMRRDVSRTYAGNIAGVQAS